MIDTTELGGGSYPEPPEPKEESEEIQTYDEWYADYYFEELYYGGE